tara:strand:- start:469 stop:648 length:180 start_codon:yes stop_codon:yes gene_type:complete
MRYKQKVSENLDKATQTMSTAIKALNNNSVTREEALRVLKQCQHNILEASKFVSLENEG